MKLIQAILALALLIGTASATNFEIVRQVPNSGPTNFVGTNNLPVNDLDPNWAGWTPLNPGDTFTGVNDFGNAMSIAVGAKLPESAPVSRMNQDFFNHPKLNTLPRSETVSSGTQPQQVSTVAVSPEPVAPVHYNFVRQVPNSGQTNFVGTDYLPTSDSDPNWTGWTPLNPGDTFTAVDDFGNQIEIPVGPKITLQKRSTVNSWLTLSRKGGALRVMN